MAEPTPAEMHKNKQKSYSDSQKGAQIGACVNKAVDIVIAEGLKEGGVPDRIESWVDILYNIGEQKKDDIQAEQEKNTEEIPF